MKDIIVVGGGLAGLITAHVMKKAQVIEAGPRFESHRALMRFRSKEVAEATGIPFREVRVHKEISYGGNAIHQPTIALANQYSSKVTGAYSGRSIWNLDTSRRYVAPDDFYDQLVDNLEREKRITFRASASSDFLINRARKNIVSTMPLPVLLDTLGLTTGHDFKRASIRVDRYRVKDADLYQTIYFPDHDVSVFRASLTGSLLTVESIGNPADSFLAAELQEVLDAFGLGQVDKIDTVNQKFGKIIDLPKEERERILFALTREYNIFSVGRFATWRNILLDDVVKDISVVQSLLHASDYGRGKLVGNK